VVRRLAAIDLGTNTVRLLVVEASGSQWRTLHEEQRVTRLGEGQATATALQTAPMRRTAAAVAEFALRAEGLGVGDVRIVATSAVREASNGGEFVDLVRSFTGREMRVITGKEEARLTLLGVSGGLPALRGSFLLFDVGGGSTEFVVAEAGKPAALVSLRLGVVELAERFMGAGPVDPERDRAMTAEIETRLARGLTKDILHHDASTLVGSAGTVTTLAALDLCLDTYDARRVHGHRLTRAAIGTLRARLAALSLPERAALPCLEPGRADLIVPGAAICMAAMDTLGFEDLLVSDRGLREGILCEILAKR
jgi:exopolyphosphatase / guanosine-5'-triphosphate,3'-diphosphate pyrophosphatase